MTTLWEERYAERMEGMKSSVIRELLKITMQPDVISFAGGLPAPELFPIRDFGDACRYILSEQGHTALQYGPSEGFPPLVEWLCEKMKRYGVPAEPHNVVITCGAQQALDLIGKVFIDPGDVILVEKPTYLGALQAWNAYQAQFATVPIDDDGMQVDLLEKAVIQHRPKFIYVLPNFQNPAGTTLPLERRQKLVAIADKHGVPIVEDDPYGELRFEGEDITPIITLHKENTLYLGTFSKTLAPGLRIGWIVGPHPVIRRIVQAKQGADLHTSSFVQMLAYDICSRGLLKGHIAQIRAVYKERRDVMLQALERYAPAGVTWTKPLGGLFLWVRMPEGFSCRDLMEEAVKQKVAFVPGTAFYVDGAGDNTMRLNFSNAQPAMIQEGIKRLCTAMRQFMECDIDTEAPVM
ncbi:MAG: PLP-dependent aminotransferase family protein [Chloroflexi bacterium]|nr:PLP-dependent aminotransferase family protein [Chloroflexota bacterium]MBU1752064.1 PLP-dependent aminotransferase family protein [Chloroflexota bacterium]